MSFIAKRPTVRVFFDWLDVPGTSARQLSHRFLVRGSLTELQRAQLLRQLAHSALEEARKLEACPGHALASPPARGTDCEGSSPSQSVR
jgi:hypothetical protein